MLTAVCPPVWAGGARPSSPKVPPPPRARRASLRRGAPISLKNSYSELAPLPLAGFEQGELAPERRDGLGDLLADEPGVAVEDGGSDGLGVLALALGELFVPAGGDEAVAIPERREAGAQIFEEEVRARGVGEVECAEPAPVEAVPVEPQRSGLGLVVDEPQRAAAHAEAEQGFTDGLGAVAEGEAVGVVGGEGHICFIVFPTPARFGVRTNPGCELSGRPFAALVCASWVRLRHLPRPAWLPPSGRSESRLHTRGHWRHASERGA